MKNRILIVLAMVLLLAGLGTLLYPTFKTATVREQEREEIAAFEEYRATATTPNTTVLPTGEPSQTEDPTGAESAERIFPELWEACVAFNEQLPNDLYFPLREVMALTVSPLFRLSFSPFSQVETR